MERFFQILQGFGIGRLGAVVGVAAAVGVALLVLVFKVGAQPDGLLYSNVDLRESGAITEALDQAGIKYHLKGDGSTIMVPRDKVGDARVLIANKGLPTSGSVGYELFDQNNLGQTDFVQKLNKQRAMEGELARTLRAMNGVTFSRVQLNLPQRQPFEEEASPPTAAVVIGAGRQISAEQVRSVQNLIAAAVPNMKPDSVAVIDQTSGKTLAGGGEGEGSIGALAAERRVEAEESLKRKIKELVEGVVGVGKARVSVTADLDLSRITLQDEKFDPDGQVARSTTAVSEEAKEGSSGGIAGGGVSTANNLPGGDAGDSSDSSSNNIRTEETTNFEVSKTVRTEVTEPGAIKRLAVAVALDGVPEATRAQIEQLVRSSVGLVNTAERQDTLTVTSIKFAASTAATGGAVSKSPLAAFDKNDIMRAAELGILLVVAALIIFFVVRPLLKTAGEGGLLPMPMLAQAGSPNYGGGPTVAQIGYDPQSSPTAYIAGPPDENRIDMARIEGQVRASSVKQVSDFVDRHPEESVSILRSWLHEA